MTPAPPPDEDDPSSAVDGLPPLRAVIAKYELNARKSLGQNFLLDLNLTRKIARTAGLLTGRTVVEIGPGPGGLTRALLLEGAARVVAIERDHRCIAALDEVSRRWPDKLHVIEADALDIVWTELVQPYLWPDEPKPLIVANLPYGIATKLLVGWLTEPVWPPWYDRMTLMFQREVAERIIAAPRTSAYGRLAVLAQWRSEPEIVLRLPPDAFVPKPKVASAVVNFSPRGNPQPACEVRALARLTAAIFGQRRKMLRSSLRQVSTDPARHLEALGLSPELRGEDLDVTTIVALAAQLDGR